MVAVRSSDGAFISWRLLGTEPDGIGFNVYRTAGSGSPVKLNSSLLTGGTCFRDTGLNISIDNSYYVVPVLDGENQEVSEPYVLKANTPVEPCLVVPLGGDNTDAIHFVWVGDLDGNGEYDFVLDRLNWEGRPQSIEAYLRDGSLLWTMDLGPNSTNTYNIEPGSSTIDVGHWDGVTVYDLDSDGLAEVAIRTANGVTFGDGRELVNSNDNKQFISILDGMTGAEKARAEVPEDYISDGPMAAHLGVGYFNGQTPSLVASMKNRVGSAGFNMMVCTWDYDGENITQRWKWKRGNQDCPDAHQMRIADVDNDGKDEYCNIGFVIDDDGTLLYTLGPQGVVHGDRYHIGRFDPDSDDMFGYAIQQDNASGLLEYYYNATTGEILWEYSIDGTADVGRGDVGDIDPRYPGYECWAFEGVFNGPTGTRITDVGVEPYPVLRLWWDDDLLSESFNDGKIEKWYYTSSGAGRLVTTWNYEGATRSDRGCPMFYGDIFGDWREEVVMTSWDFRSLVIFTTDVSTSERLYTLPHNPEYRNCMTVKGYMQSHHVDYYLGSEMDTPPSPDIIAVGTVVDENETIPPTPNAMVWEEAPYALDHNSIAMEAKFAFDLSGVEYYFTCTYGGGHDSGWQSSPYYVDTDLLSGQVYTYTVAARDNSNNYNTTFASVPGSCTLGAAKPALYWNFEDGVDGYDFTQASNGSYDKILGVLMQGSAGSSPSWAGETLTGHGLSMKCESNSEYGYISAAGFNGWSPSSWTIECAVYLNEIAGWKTLIGRDGSSQGDASADFYLQKNGLDDKFRVNIDTVGGERWILDSDTVAVAGKWYRIAVSSDGITLKMYIDGGNGYSQVGTLDISDQSVAENALAATNYNWVFGRGWYGGNQTDFIDGYLDDIRMSTKVLDISELLGYSSGAIDWVYGDFSGDGEVNMADFSIFAQFVLNRSLSSLEGYDVNNDGMITLPELEDLAGNWLYSAGD